MAHAEQPDFKTDTTNGTNGFHVHDTGVIPESPARMQYVLTPEAEEYVQQVEAEIASLGAHAPLTRGLAERELCRIKTGEVTEQGYMTIHKDTPIRVQRKVLIPTKDYPTVNFVGKLLGPKGSTLKGLQQSCRAKIMIFGRGSMWDKNKEEEARVSGDPKYAHLNEDLHVFVEVTAYPVEVQARFAHIMSELKKFLDPNHPSHYLVTGGGDAPFAAPIRPPPGIRGPPAGYRPIRPPGGAMPPRAYGAPPRPAAPAGQAPAYDTSGYYGVAPSAESAYQAPAVDTSSGYGYASYPAQPEYAAAPAQASYDTQAAQAQQYAAQQQQQQYAAATQQQQPAYQAQPAYGQQPAAQPAYGQAPQQQQPAYGQQPAASGYAAQATYGQQPVYAAAAAAPTYGGYAAATAAQPRPQYGASPVAKKPRLASPYGY